MAYNINDGTKLTSTGKLMATGQKFHAVKKSSTATPSLQIPLKVSVVIVDPRGMASNVTLASPKLAGTPLPKQHKFNRFSIQSVKRTDVGMAAAAAAKKLDEKIVVMETKTHYRQITARSESARQKGFGKLMQTRQIRKVLTISKSLEYQGAGVWA